MSSAANLIRFKQLTRALTSCLVLFCFANGYAQAQSTPAPPTPAPTPRSIVVIDAAHGGADSGSQLANGAIEKNITLAISVRLRSLLSARGIYVITTRESDAAIDVNHRVEVANHAGAIACISIHATASGVGIHLFTSSLAPTAPSKFSPWKTAQSAWIPQSLALAGIVNSTLQQSGLSVSVARTNLPGLDSMTCPAIAVELATPTGDDNNPAPELTDPAYQAHIAELLTAAILEWRAEARKP